MALKLGSVTGVPGQVVRGKHPLIKLATAPADDAGMEELAVVIITAPSVTAASPGPRVLITANIHGPEICPTIVAHRLIEHCEAALRAGDFSGSLVVYPSLNPTGHRAATRHPQFENPDRTDPNRMWPNTNPFANSSGVADPALASDPLKQFYDLEVSTQTPTAKCWATLFEMWRPCGFQVHLDLHTMGHHLCNPFTYLHHTLYDDTDPGFTKADAEALAAKMVALHGAIGLSILVEPPPTVRSQNHPPSIVAAHPALCCAAPIHPIRLHLLNAMHSCRLT
eukprot:SAG31_NODE_2601_length_5363_cov_2.456173_1_plen_281_part_00